MEKLDYFIRRFLLVIPTFLGITLLCFALIQFVPGGPVEQIVMRMKGIGAAESGKSSGLAGSISEDQRKAIEAHFGFDKPFFQRYWKWLVADRLGMRMESYKFPNKTAWQLIKERFKVSLIFGITGFVLSYLVCIPLGILKALRHDKAFDLISSVIVFIGYAIPPFAFGMVLKMLFCGTVDGLWDFFPVSGFHSDNYMDRYLYAHVFAGTVLYYRNFCRPDLSHEKFFVGADQQRLHPHCAGQRRKLRARDMGTRTAQLLDSHRHRIRCHLNGDVCRLRDH
jgi:microcin C transport system permease protein